MPSKSRNDVAAKIAENQVLAPNAKPLSNKEKRHARQAQAAAQKATTEARQIAQFVAEESAALQDEMRPITTRIRAQEAEARKKLEEQSVRELKSLKHTNFFKSLAVTQSDAELAILKQDAHQAIEAADKALYNHSIEKNSQAIVSATAKLETLKVQDIRLKKGLFIALLVTVVTAVVLAMTITVAPIMFAVLFVPALIAGAAFIRSSNQINKAQSQLDNLLSTEMDQQEKGASASIPSSCSRPVRPSLELTAHDRLVAPSVEQSQSPTAAISTVVGEQEATSAPAKCCCG